MQRVMRQVDLAADGTAAGDTVHTGFPSVDRWLGGGLRAGDLVVLGGDVGSGKSSLALAMAVRMAQDGRAVTFFSTEMSPERTMERAVALEGRARIDDMRKGTLDEVARAGVGAAAVRMRDAMPTIGEVPHSVEDIVMHIRSDGRDNDVVIVDSLQGLVGNTAHPMEEEEANAVRAIKRAALERSIPVLLTSQLRRPARPDDDHRPTLVDFGANDAVRHHADVVTAIYREEMYHPGGGVEGGTEFLILKNRNGSTGYVDLYFYRQWLRFEDMLDPDR